MKSILIAIIAFSTITSLCCRHEQSSDSESNVRVDVRATAVRSGSIEETISATGSTIIQREAQLRSPITGILVHFKYYNGDRIKKGDMIAEVRTKESQAALQGAEALLQSAGSRAEREEAEKALRLAQSTNTTIAINAPFDGILNNKSKNELEFVPEGEQVATFIDPASIIFVADVPASQLTRIREGQHARVRFTTKNEKILQGIVHRIEPLLNPHDQTAHVQIVLSNTVHDLEGSLFGEAEIIVGRHEKSLLVPYAALLRDDENNTTTVMLVGRDSLAHRVNISVGVKQDSLAEIFSNDVTAGDLVITEGHYGLADSTKVRVVP